ncbi:MAG: isoprenyl transferase [Alphaproteobacteria bacterium]
MTQPPSETPAHVAVIMDGNGRWAKERGLPRIEGHRRGVRAVRETVTAARESGVRYLTLFGFSTENWRRPEDEVAELMGLLRRYLKSEIAELHSNGVQLRVIGNREKLPTDIVKLIEDSEGWTAENHSLTLILALSYGGRHEIADAARRIAKSATLGLINPDAVDEDVFAAHLDTAGIPDPDLLIRTSGETRISNFLLWQMAYTEFFFIDKKWPDFCKDDFQNALSEFKRRDRRYGASASKA